jgi:hypothetical protein
VGREAAAANDLVVAEDLKLGAGAARVVVALAYGVLQIA